MKFIISYFDFYVLAIMALALNSCESDRNKRGYNYLPDMAYSMAYETYAPNPIFEDGKTAQSPVEGTIPRHIIPYQYPNTSEGLKLAGLELRNPVESSMENLLRGKNVYNIFCANCHGFNGKGDGNLYASGKYPSEPPSLISTNMINKPDGEFYHIITSGSAIMGSFASIIKPEDRWKIILYLKEELSKGDVNQTY